MIDDFVTTLKRILSPGAVESPLLAIGLMLFALVMLSAQDALVKTISSSTTLWQFQLFRSGLNIVLVLLVGRLILSSQSLKPVRPSVVMIRSLFHVGALCFFFAGAPYLLLAEMAAGLYTFPLFVVLISVVLGSESVGPRRLLAVLAGFVGTVLILKPGGDTFRPIALLPVGAGFCYGCFVVVTRKLCQQESPLVLVLGSNVMIICVALLGSIIIRLAPVSDLTRDGYPFLLSINWSFDTFLLLAITVCALLNTTANLCLGKAYQSADSSFLAPVDYSYLLFAVFWGYVLWRDVPDLSTVAGMIIIAGAGTFVAWRERIAAD